MGDGFDFDFLITILMYWKKVKYNPARSDPCESDPSVLKSRTDSVEVDETNKNDLSSKGDSAEIKESMMDKSNIKSKIDSPGVEKSEDKNNADISKVEENKEKDHSKTASTLGSTTVNDLKGRSSIKESNKETVRPETFVKKSVQLVKQVT